MAMKRLSRPIDQMADHYSAVVVGSGYGGAIVAARIARAGRDVCVLERGKELHPGEYPNSALTGLRETQVGTPTGQHGSATAMFDFHVGPDITVLVGCGLGGTSLINANVALEPKDWIFQDGRWPAQLRGQPGELKRFMPTVKKMLGSRPYPQDWPELPRLKALSRAAEELGRTVSRPAINVTFTDGPNAAGVEQKACVLCGDCCLGCNHGAKNTVLMNYLPDAHAHGAHIFTEVAVRSVHRWQDKWRVAFDVLAAGRGRYGTAPSQFITADVVVLAAGTLGSTEILLRSQARGLPVSGRLGEGFSGNGDVLAFAYDTDRSVRGVGLGRRVPSKHTAVGPTITGMIDLRDTQENLEKALIIEDGAIPGALAAMLPAAMYAASYGSSHIDAGQGPSAARRLRELAEIPLGSYRGPIDHTLTYLIMSTDNSGGRILLAKDRIQVEWPEVAEQPVFLRDNEILATATEALHGIATPDPLWAWTSGRSLITVHPLGGCVMGDDATKGVVDHAGRVFDPVGGGVHQGLYVCDGSVVPLALDANPLLTISAIAERTAEIMIRDRNWATGPKAGLPPAPPPPEGAVPKARLTFTERLTGFVSTRVHEDYQQGYESGRDDGALVEILVTIDYDDVQAMLNDPGRQARISGTVLAPELSPHRLTVTEGCFTLLDRDLSRVETWHMRYRMTLRAEEGNRYSFDGYKVLRKRGARYAWGDTTTLYATIKEVDGPKRGLGILHLQPMDFTILLRSIDVRGVSRRKQNEYRSAFLDLFVEKIAHIYGGVLDEAGAFPSARRKAPGAGRPRDPDEIWWCEKPKRWHTGDMRADDFLRLTHYQGGSKGPVMLAPGFGMSSHSFLASTIEVNLTEFLAERGYDVWLFDYRAGIDLPSARREFSIDDIACTDWPLAVRQVLQLTKQNTLQVFGHCVGSVSLQMAILDGMPGIRSAVCAQFPLHPVTSVFNRVKSGLRVANVLDDLGVSIVAPDNRRSPPDEFLDVLLRTLPLPSQERCGQAVCRWINAIYGCTHRHAQLNDPTHRALNDMFGIGNIDAIKHLTLMMRKSLAVTRDGKKDYFKHPERMANVRLLLLQGRHNYIFHPDGTLRTLHWLRTANPEGEYERVVLPDYAHLDAIIGARAAADVYPRIADFLDQDAETGGAALTPQPSPVPDRGQPEVVGYPHRGLRELTCPSGVRPLSVHRQQVTVGLLGECLQWPGPHHAVPLQCGLEVADGRGETASRRGQHAEPVVYGPEEARHA
jgi:cholesterol oxidase